jgi:hypothetical protein
MDGTMIYNYKKGNKVRSTFCYLGPTNLVISIRGCRCDLIQIKAWRKEPEAELKCDVS